MLDNSIIQKIIKTTPIIVIDIGILFLVLNYHGHIDLLTDQQRTDKINQLNHIIKDEGCIHKQTARKKLNLSKHEMIEVIRNATNYQSSIDKRLIFNYSNQRIIRCYMVQTSTKHTPRNTAQPIP